MNNEVLQLLPIVIPAMACVVILLFAAFLPSRAISMTIAIAALIGGAYFTRFWSETSTLFLGTIHIDPFAQISAIFCFLITGIAAFAAPSYLRRINVEFNEEYYALLMAATAGMVVMVATNDLMVLFVNLELVSITTYIMCGMNRYSEKSTESALKYFVNGAAASAFMLFGIALVYGISASTSLSAISVMLHSGSGIFPTPLFPLALLLIAIGFFFKLGIVPFHAWLPDVYEGAPTPTTGFMAAAIRTVVGIAFIRIVVNLFEPGMSSFNSVIWWLSVISMSVGNVAALRQNSVKRMLAWSSVAHAGYLLIGFVGLSATNLLGAEAILYYLISYALMSLGIFIVIGQVEGRNESNLSFDSYRGIGLRQPLIGILTSMLLLSLTGIPPFAGFWGKFSLFSSAVHNGFTGLAIIAALNSVVSAYYYFRLMVSMYMSGEDQSSPQISYASSPHVTAALLLCTGLVLWLGIGPVSIAGVIPSVNELWRLIANGTGFLR